MAGSSRAISPSTPDAAVQQDAAEGAAQVPRLLMSRLKKKKKNPVKPRSEPDSIVSLGCGGDKDDWLSLRQRSGIL